MWPAASPVKATYYICHHSHYIDIIMRVMASKITNVSIVCSIVCSGADQRKHQSSASLAFVRVNSPVTGKFPAQRASNAENGSIWWRHYVCRRTQDKFTFPGLLRQLVRSRSNGNIFCVTGTLYGEFTGHRWIPLTQWPVTRSFVVFSVLRLYK